MRFAQLVRSGCAFVCLGAASCSAPTYDPWASLLPQSPCYDVDLRDGLDDGDELATVFACLDHHGHLTSLRPTMDALGDGGGLDPLATTLVRGAEALAAASVADPYAPSLPDEGQQLVVLELLSGVPGASLASDEPDLTEAPWQGLGPAAEALIQELASQPRAVAALGAMLRHPALKATATASRRARDERQGAFVAPLTHHSAAALASADPDGVLLGDWLDVWVVDPLGALPISFFHLQLLTEAPTWRAEVVEQVAQHPDLSDVPASLAWLATVDADGAPLASGRVSALERILELMEQGTHPVECTVGIEPLAIDLSFDDLTLRLLRIVAGMEPGTLGSASSVWSTLTDNRVADAAFDAAVASGACPDFDEGVQEGLDALDLLTAEEAAPLLQIVGPILDSTEDHQALPALAAVLGNAGQPEARRTLTALVAAVAAEPQAALAARGLQGLASPLPGSEPALRHLLDGFAYALTGDDDIGPPAVIAYPWVRKVAADPNVRRAVGRIGRTWGHPDSHMVSPPLVDEASLQVGFDVLATLGGPDVVEPLLDALATDGVVQALLADASTDGAAPLADLEHAIRLGTVADAMSWFAQAMDTAGG